jgi:hypothetical protein
LLDFTNLAGAKLVKSRKQASERLLGGLQPRVSFLVST